MGWGKEWVKQPIAWPEAMSKLIEPVGPNVWAKTFIENGEIKQEIIPPEEMYTNLKPTHDPYTNPGALIYYQCNCGAILDPKTKSFASLNNAAMNAGWKVRWNSNGQGYEPFCVKCGEGVE